MSLAHEMLVIPFPVEHGVALIRVPREGITPADAERMAAMVKAVVVVDTDAAALPRIQRKTEDGE